MEDEPDQMSDDDSTLEFSIEVVESSSSAKSLEPNSDAEEEHSNWRPDDGEQLQVEASQSNQISGSNKAISNLDQQSERDETLEPEARIEQNDSETRAINETSQLAKDDGLELHETEHEQEQVPSDGFSQSGEKSHQLNEDHDQQLHQAGEHMQDEVAPLIDEYLDASGDLENPQWNADEANETNKIVLSPHNESSNSGDMNQLVKSEPNDVDFEMVQSEELVGEELAANILNGSINEIQQNSADEQQLERQQQLIEEQLIELVEEEEKQIMDEQGMQEATLYDGHEGQKRQQLEQDLANYECDQWEQLKEEADIEECERHFEEVNDNDTDGRELQEKPQINESHIDEVVNEEPNKQLEQLVEITRETQGDNLIEDPLKPESGLGEANAIVQEPNQGNHEIPNINQLDTNFGSNQAAAASRNQLGSPDIQINGVEGVKDNEIDKHDCDIDLGLQKVTLEGNGCHDDDVDCKTPTTPANLLVDSNFLGYVRDKMGENEHLFDCESDQEDLEAEFENEPEFEARQVSPKRGVAPTCEYNFADELGRGKFGTVYRVKNKLSGLELAAKMISIRRQEDLKDLESEVAIMCQLQHPRLLQLYDAFVDFECELTNGGKQICLITELIEGGELFERIVNDDFNLTEKKAAIFMRQICEAVDYMHSMGIVHLDMKPENILCVSKTSNRIKLIDFGLARKLEPGQALRVMFGTPDFAAPEVLGYDVVSYATDMWSVGVICYVLLSGLSPFMGDSDVETMANVQRATYDFDSDVFDPITELAKDFISKLLVKDPKLRLKPRECLEHPWLEKGARMLSVAMRSRRESMISIMSSKSDCYDLTNIIGPSGICSLTSLNKRNLKKYVIRRKWHKTVNAIMALGRMGANLKQKLTGVNQT